MTAKNNVRPKKVTLPENLKAPSEMMAEEAVIDKKVEAVVEEAVEKALEAKEEHREEEQVLEKKIQMEGEQKTFFDRIAFLRLTDKRKSKVADKVLTDLRADKLYVIEMVLSCVIAALGLLINSTAVVIGAMLIAPILRPIQGMAFSMSTGSNSLYLKAGRLLLFSIFVGVGISALVAYLVPFSAPTPEILARTSPTILDLMIALASGLIAILSLGFVKLSESIAGVAMAASLVPPLCVTGIGIAWLDWQIAQGSFLLFLANLIAIIIVGVIIFYAYGFYPTNKEGQNTSAKQIVLIALTTLIVIAPLYTGLQTIVSDFNINSGIQAAIKASLPGIDANASIEDLTYELNNDTVSVKVSLRTSDTTRIRPDDKAQIIQEIANRINKPVSLSLELIPTTSVFVPKPVELTIEERVLQELQSYLNPFDNVYLIDANVSEEAEQPVVSIELYSEVQLNYPLVQQDLQDRLSFMFATTPLLLLDIESKPLMEVSSSGFGEILEQNLIATFETLFSGSELNTLSISQETKIIQKVVGTELVTGTNLSGEIATDELQILRSEATDVVILTLDIATDLLQQEVSEKLARWKQDLEEEVGTVVQFDVQLREFVRFSLE